MVRSNHRISLRIWAVALAVLVVTAARPWGLLAQGPTPSKVKFATVAEAMRGSG